MLLPFAGTSTIAWAATENETNKEYRDEVISQIQLEPSINQAVGTKYQPILQNNELEAGTYSLNWISSKPKVAKITAKDGVISALTEGKTIITCILTVGEKQYKYSSQLTVTNPKFDQKVYYVATKSKIRLPITGTSTTDIMCQSSNDKVALPADEGTTVTGKSAGTVYITAEVDRRYITCKVIVSSPKLNYTDLFLESGKKATIKVTGHSKTTPITFTSSDKKIATVSSSGSVKAVKQGSTVITVTVDQKVYSCYVGIGKTEVVTSMTRAYEALGCTYSQANRMKEGYYDCSSLIWRSFSPAGYYFGDKKYAPTAASQAQSLVKEKKAIAYKGLELSGLLPGDILYMNSTVKNGRYKNISHVAIYIGNGRILHARDEKGGVCIDSYDSYKKRVVVVARL